jgi:hypothetical protein
MNNTFGTRLGILKQVLGLSYEELLAKLESDLTTRSLKNYVDNKTQMSGDLISKVPEVFPTINEMWWYTGNGQILKTEYKGVTVAHMPKRPGKHTKEESVAVLQALIADMRELHGTLTARLEYYEQMLHVLKS